MRNRRVLSEGRPSFGHIVSWYCGQQTTLRVQFSFGQKLTIERALGKRERLGISIHDSGKDVLVGQHRVLRAKPLEHEANH